MQLRGLLSEDGLVLHVPDVIAAGLTTAHPSSQPPSSSPPQPSSSLLSASAASRDNVTAPLPAPPSPLPPLEAPATLLQDLSLDAPPPPSDASSVGVHVGKLLVWYRRHSGEEEDHLYTWTHPHLPTLQGGGEGGGGEGEEGVELHAHEAKVRHHSRQAIYGLCSHVS